MMHKVIQHNKGNNETYRKNEISESNSYPLIPGRTPVNTTRSLISHCDR